ncbi:FKBP-type peptidyl-prolyl cis-trans isomerase [Proteus terrae]|uniref:FKBP-type peptidyl-prolyl cis-trans isomerase n=1 Tax=Proteus terrae TaxID=1574161 RepID=UPI000D68594F|nr:FKBP-type peptidyl-prolyl cis-trans isomerase [Proteus terrae]
MKSLLKTTLLATSLAFAFSAPHAFAEEATAKVPTLNSAFKTQNEQNAYALGASMGRYMEAALQEQKNIGITLDSKQLLAGVQDAFNSKSKLSDAEIELTLAAFEDQVRTAATAKMEKEAAENKAAGDKFRTEFAAEKGVVKTKSGLLYLVENPGKGKTPTDADRVTVNYKGMLIDGKQFDSSYDRNEPLTISLKSVIPGWTEGMKYIKEGGKIKLVIPPELGYGQRATSGIPANSTLVFEVELLSVESDK